MTRTRTCALGLVALFLVTGTWFLWAVKLDDDWQDFTALGVLFSGLAFVGLVFTISIQLNELVSQEKTTQASLQTTQESLATMKTQAEVLALSALRDFVGREIDHLKGLVEAGTTESEGLTPQEAENRIQELKRLIPRIGNRIKTIAFPEFIDAFDDRSRHREAESSGNVEPTRSGS